MKTNLIINHLFYAVINKYGLIVPIELDSITFSAPAAQIKWIKRRKKLSKTFANLKVPTTK